MLQKLSQKYKLCVTTGVHPKVFWEKEMPKFNFPQVFSQIIFAYDVEPAKQKPNPYTIEAILKKQLIKKEEAVMVGDAKSDVQMAFNAQVEPIVVLTGHLNRQEAESLGVKKIIDNVL